MLGEERGHGRSSRNAEDFALLAEISETREMEWSQGGWSESAPMAGCAGRKRGPNTASMGEGMRIWKGAGGREGNCQMQRARRAHEPVLACSRCRTSGTGDCRPNGTGCQDQSECGTMRHGRVGFAVLGQCLGGRRGGRAVHVRSEDWVGRSLAQGSLTGIAVDSHAERGSLRGRAAGCGKGGSRT